MSPKNQTVRGAVQMTLEAMRAELTDEHNAEIARAAIVADRIGLRRYVGLEISVLDVAVENVRSTTLWTNSPEHVAVINLIAAAEAVINAWKESWKQ